MEENKNDKKDENFSSVLNGQEIINQRNCGNIVIEPFSKSCVNSSSYDITLGDNFYKFTKKFPKNNIYNP